MPQRSTIFVNGEIYHIYNRGIASQPTFLDKRDWQRAIASIFYYQNAELPCRYSKFLILARDVRDQLYNDLRKRGKLLVGINAYCLMPNHFHLLLNQLKENGIQTFIRNFTDSYTRYLNTKYERNGPLFQGRFKARRIETEDQLLHIQRYIHLNPYSSFVVKTIEELENYPYSSLPEYLGNRSKLEYCKKEIILKNFKNLETYKSFVFDQADYQRTLNNVKHLLLEG